MVSFLAHHHDSIALVERGSRLFANDYIRFTVQWASIALLWYDYILTFNMEVKYIWGQKLRLSTILYACCRYALVANILYLFVINNKCDVWSKAITSLGILGRFAIIVTFTTRTYIICNRNRYVLAYLSVLGLAWMVASFMHISRIDCSGTSDIPTLLLSTLMGVFELSAAVITFTRCMQTVRLTNRSGVRARHFFMLILEQGILYLIFTALFTTVAIVLNYRAQPGTFCQRLLIVIAMPLSCILTARFLLHLRWLEAQLEKGDPRVSCDFGEQDTIGLGTLRFNHTSHITSITEDLGVERDVDEQMDRYVSTDVVSIESDTSIV